MNTHEEPRERLLSEPAANFTRNYGHIEVSKIAVKQNPTCYYYIKEKTIKCERDLERSIAHEILHFLNDRFPEFSERFFNAKGGYKDRLKIAQTLVPEFGVTKSTPSVWEKHCIDGPISREKEQTQCYGSAKYIEQNNNKYCIYEEESLYAFVRGGEEYIQTLLEEAILNPGQFEKIASQEEKEMFTILDKYLF